uniref:ERCC3/RAD25/XPB helicase C-terminal domain-containing protein n=1 Tax=Natrinema halophilum TaxID=1699371 RepID=A0A7D5GNT0_9EURY
MDTNVLKEGIDVPEASVGAILSGSGSEREFRQRFGRIHRPKANGRRALLYEIVSKDTGKERIADRRRD